VAESWRNVRFFGLVLGLEHMRGLGRSLQILGLVLLPVGLIYGVEGGPNSMALEIGFGVAGVAVFLLGLALQRRGAGQEPTGSALAAAGLAFLGGSSMCSSIACRRCTRRDTSWRRPCSRCRCR